MFNDLGILKAAAGLARHAAYRQAVIAENIANADTPGFKARDLAPFSEVFELLGSSEPINLENQKIKISGTEKPNGNTVSIEDQMQRSAASARDHATALALYGKTLSILRATLGRR